MNDAVRAAGLLLMLVTVTGLILILRAADQRRRDGRRNRFELRFPTHMTSDSVEAFLAALGGLPRTWWPHRGESTVVFEVVARPHEVRHYLRAPEGQVPYVIGQLRGALPSVRVRPAYPEPEKKPVAALELRLSALDRKFGDVSIRQPRGATRRRMRGEP